MSASLCFGGGANPSPYVKDAFHAYVVSGQGEAVNPERTGTKAAAHYVLDVPGGGSRTVRLRLAAARVKDPFGGFEKMFESRIADAASRAQIARMTVRILFATGAVRVNTDTPFMFSSGWASPVYVECQRVMAHPDLRQTLMALAAGEIERRVGVATIDTVVGGEDAGVCFAAWLADALRKPLNFVRTRTHGFGRNSQIEGELRAGARALLVGDLTTDGVSKAQFATALRAAGAEVRDVFVLFYFDVFDDARPHLEAAGLRLHALANWADIVAVAREDGLFDAATLAEVDDFRADPAGWSARHGGLAHLPPPERTSLP